MKKILLKQIFSLLLCAACTLSLSAQTPRLISYQGLLTDAGGQPLADGNYTITVKLYDLAQGGTALWTEARNITLTNGIFNILLGEITPLDLPFDQLYYLGTTFNGNELSPRTTLAAAPYAIGSENGAKAYALDAFGGGTENVVFVDASTSVGIGTETPDPSVKLHVNGDIRVADDSNVFGLDGLWGFNDLRFFGNVAGNQNGEDMIIKGNGNVGIGVFSPKGRLHVNGDYYGLGHLWLHAYEGDGNSGTAYIQGRDDSGTSSIGLKFRTQLNGSYLDAISISESGNMSFNNSNVYENTALNISSLDDNLYAVYIEKKDETFLAGFLNNGNLVIGEDPDFIGLNVKSSSPLLINAGVLGGGDVFAVTAAGQVFINGTLSVSGSKNFILDHPLDPANKSLVHNAVESPDRITQYQGTVKLDADGSATVELPDYFEALNKDFNYQLTCVGGFAQVYIASEIAENQFRIAGGQPGLKVSWQVTATRNDPYARDHAYEPVIEKKGIQKGRYWYPQGYHQDESMGMKSYDEKDVLSKRNKK